MKVWLICDDYYHPGEVVVEGTLPLTDAGFSFTVTKDVAGFLAERLSEYPVVLFSKSDHTSAANREKWMTPAIQRKFVEYVENGGGLLVTHSGLAGYGQEPMFTDLIGCNFTGHPEQCPVTMAVLKPHIVTKGVSHYTETDEHYFIDVLAADADVFMATASTNGAQAGGYTRVRGKGRICVLTPGHNTEVWLNPNHQTLLANALRWCGGE